MDKEVIEYDIAIQDEEDIAEYNKFGREIHGDDFNPFKTTDEHVDILIDKVYDAIEKVGDSGGWYLGDGIKVKIEIEYEPENK